jgi:hypothetical protein
MVHSDEASTGWRNRQQCQFATLLSLSPRVPFRHHGCLCGRSNARDCSALIDKDILYLRSHTSTASFSCITSHFLPPCIARSYYLWSRQLTHSNFHSPVISTLWHRLEHLLPCNTCHPDEVTLEQIKSWRYYEPLCESRGDQERFVKTGLGTNISQCFHTSASMILKGSSKRFCL